MAPQSSRVTIPAAWLALLCGVLGGLLTFAATAALWRAGEARIGSACAEAALLLALVATALVTLLAQPTRLRRARVPAGRALPHAWWPQQNEAIPVIAVCVGTPVAAGAGVALVLFR